MSNIIKSTPLNYRIKVEKIDKDGNSEIVGDTGFVKPQIIEFINFLMKLMNLDLENKEFRNKLNHEISNLENV